MFIMSWRPTMYSCTKISRLPKQPYYSQSNQTTLLQSLNDVEVDIYVAVRPSIVRGELTTRKFI